MEDEYILQEDIYFKDEVLFSKEQINRYRKDNAVLSIQSKIDGLRLVNYNMMRLTNSFRFLYALINIGKCCQIVHIAFSFLHFCTLFFACFSIRSSFLRTIVRRYENGQDLYKASVKLLENWQKDGLETIAVIQQIFNKYAIQFLFITINQFC